MPLLQTQENHAPGSLSKATFRLLLIEPLPQNTAPIAISLSKTLNASFDIIHASSLEDAIERMKVVSFDALVWRLPYTEWHILENIAFITDLRPYIPIVLLTDTVDEEFALESLHYGVQDCISLEQCNSTRIAHTIVYAIERKRVTGAVFPEHEMTDSDNRKNLVMDMTKTHTQLHEEEINLAEIVENRTFELMQANMKLQDEINEHKLTEQELQHHHDHLEELVNERTEELKNTLLQLDNEIQENRHAESTEKKHIMEAAHIARINTMGEMITEIAHELNQPLAAISIYSDACVRLLESGNPDQEEIVGALQQINNQAIRADQIIKRIREFVRRKEPRLGDLDINELVQEVMHLVEIETRWYGIELQVFLSDPLPNVLADRILIEQVILNLVRNAVEAMESIPENRRKLVIRTAWNSTGVELSVLDTGHGFSALDENSVFGAFVTSKENGVGMGLAICKSIIESHDGHLWAESNPDGGAIFHFILPVKASINNKGD